MMCFRHRDVAAVGVCSVCGRGLCPDCASEREYALACKHSHEEAVDRLTTHTVRQMDNYDKVMGTANTATRLLGMFVLVMGLVFLWYGYDSRADYGSGFSIFLMCMGGIFTLFGITRLVSKAMYPTSDSASDANRAGSGESR